MDSFTVALAVGLMVSLAVTEVFGLGTGGMIVPGYFALSVHRPLDIACTLLVAAITLGAMKLLSQFVIIYGRRRVVAALLFGFLIGAAVRAVIGTEMSAGASCVCVIGFLIPGLIALWFDRQGVSGTVGAMATATVLVRLVLIVLGMEAVL